MRLLVLILAASSLYGQSLLTGIIGGAGAAAGGGGGGGSFSVVQSKGGESSTRCDTNGSALTSVTCSFTSTPTAGNLVRVSFAWYDFDGTVTPSASDNQGNSYSCTLAAATTNKYRVGTCRALNVTSSGTFTVTVSVSSATYVAMHIYEVSGASTTSSFDAFGTTVINTSGSTTSVSTSGAPVTASEIGFASFASNSSATATGSGGWTAGEQSTNATHSIVTLWDVYKTPLSTSTQTASATYDFTVPEYSGVIATFK